MSKLKQVPSSMSDWQVGNLAVHDCALPKCESCIGDTTGIHGVLTVTVVRPFKNEPPGLDFRELPASSFGQWLYCACCFRQIRPDKHEACKPEFIALLKCNRVTA